QAIDVNGDGRIDRIDAAEEVGHWVVYLNTPDPADPGHPLWQRRTLSTQWLAARLQAQGVLIDPNHGALAHRSTAPAVTTRTCRIGDGKAWTQTDGWWVPGKCVGPPLSYGNEFTFTEWEVTDINGDGYPDVVFNSSPMVLDTQSDPDPEPPADPDVFPQWQTTTSVTTPSLPASNAIDALFNVSGVHIGTNTQPFSAVA